MKKRRWVVAVGALLAALLALVASVIVLAVWNSEYSPADYRDRVLVIQHAVDAYRSRTGHFPDVTDERTMRTLGFGYAEGPVPEFEPIDGTHYRLTFEVGFDGPCWAFDSSNDTWSKCDP